MTKTSRLLWASENLYIGTDSSGHSVVIGAADEQGNREGCKPSDLLLLALASCVCVDVVAILRKQRTPLTRLEVFAEPTNETRPPWKFSAIHLTFKMEGPGLTAERALKAVQLSEAKYCAVAASLQPQVSITLSVEVPAP
ncbi:MAG TPA: OsmC family protein [Anaerolineales bacterium]|nr:OsmC family protein [Anaerolineales bacterium]